MSLKRVAVAAAFVALGTVHATADETGVAAALAKLDQRLVAQEQRIVALEAELAKTATSAAQTRAALERDLAQPMLLLVGEWPCPYGFKRIETRVMILTRARTEITGPLFDEAGLSSEDPPGVGNNVYRDFDFCYRLPKAVGIE